LLHQAPIWIKAEERGVTVQSPFRAVADQKIVGTMPCPQGLLQSAWLLTSFVQARGMGSKDDGNNIRDGMGCQSIPWVYQLHYWFTIPSGVLCV
jgi:hypothetical protein